MLTTAAHVKTKAGRCKHSNNKEDVFIFIDAEQTIYAEDQEHVPGEVCFFSAEKCTLFFENNNPIFKTEQVSLDQGANWVPIKGKGKTHYAINEPPDTKAGPIIVVP